MAVKKVPQVFRTSDGAEFDNEEQATRHEDLLDRKHKFQIAFERLGDALAETQKTADGSLFEFGVCRDYYAIAPSWVGLPRLRKIWFSYMGENRFEINEDDEVILIHQENQSRIEYRISELYRSEKEAKKALLAAQDERLEHLRQEVEELRAEVAGAN